MKCVLKMFLMAFLVAIFQAQKAQAWTKCFDASDMTEDPCSSWPSCRTRSGADTYQQAKNLCAVWCGFDETGGCKIWTVDGWFGTTDYRYQCCSPGGLRG